MRKAPTNKGIVARRKKDFRAGVPEQRVCEVIFGILKDPEQLRAGLPCFGDEEW